MWCLLSITLSYRFRMLQEKCIHLNEFFSLISKCKIRSIFFDYFNNYNWLLILCCQLKSLKRCMKIEKNDLELAYSSFDMLVKHENCLIDDNLNGAAAFRLHFNMLICQIFHFFFPLIRNETGQTKIEMKFPLTSAPV